MMINEFGPMARRRMTTERASLRDMYGYIRPQRFALPAGAVLSLATGPARRSSPSARCRPRSSVSSARSAP
ncbi:MAG: hypothetical protein ACRDPY_11525 [Streptosporangiaceae bacterium]